MNPSRSISSPKYRFLQSLDRAQVSAAIPEFAAPVANIFRSGTGSRAQAESTAEGELWETWGTLLSVAADTPYSGEGARRQDALVDLLMGVQSQEPLTWDDGSRCTVWDMTVWEDLPIFGATVREEFNFSPSDPQNPPEARTRWPNLNAFLARVTNAFFSTSQGSSTTQTNSPLDLSLLGLWTLRDYLESPLSSRSPSSSSFAPRASDQASETALHGASVWMSYAAPTLRRMSVENKSFDGNLGNPGAIVRDRNWKGYSLERWAFWKEKFWDAKNSMERANGNEEVKRAVDQAVERMEEAERS